MTVELGNLDYLREQLGGQEDLLRRYQASRAPDHARSNFAVAATNASHLIELGLGVDSAHVRELQRLAFDARAGAGPDFQGALMAISAAVREMRTLEVIDQLDEVKVTAKAVSAHLQSTHKIDLPRRTLATGATFLVAETMNPKQADSYVNSLRIDRMRSQNSSRFNTTKIVEMLGMLNDAVEREDWHSALMLQRSILDHVPPIFCQPHFAAVAASANRTIKSALGRLQDSLRDAADYAAHSRIGPDLQMVTRQQAWHASDFDLFLQYVSAELDKRIAADKVQPS